MATVSSHILDSVSGCSAAGIRCVLYRLGENDARQSIFDVEADGEGRIAEAVEIAGGGEYELVMHGADYFRARGIESDSMVSCVVLRFAMNDDTRRYHMPLMLSPHSYSTWWSG